MVSRSFVERIDFAEREGLAGGIQLVWTFAPGAEKGTRQIVFGTGFAI
jgi:hypothetical protein